jgi:serine phosphatase RsbU (regulator of sigma subunit)/CHASE1-domain containing sensor protein
MARRGWPALALGVVLVLLSLAAAIVIFNSQRASDDREDRALARQAAAATRTALQLTGASLSGAGGLTTPSGEMPRSNFRTFAREVLATGRCTALAYAPYIGTAQRRGFERRTGARISELSPSGLQPRSQASHYAPVLFIARTTRGATARGLDQLSERTRAEALLRARDSGRPSLSAPLRFALTAEPGLTAFEAVYVPGRPQRTIAERRAAFSGVVSCPVSLSNFERRVLAELPPGVKLRVADKGTVVLGPREPLDEPARATAFALGRPMAIEATFDERTSPVIPVLVAAGGLLFAMLFVTLVQQGARNVEALERARALDDRERGRRAVLLRTAEAMQLSLDTRSRFELLMDAIVPNLADAAAAYRVEDANAIAVGYRARDDELFSQLGRIDLHGRSPRMMEAIASQRPQLISLVSDEIVEESASDARDLRARHELGIASLVLAPLIARGRTLGVLVAGRTGDSPPFDAGDVALLQELVAHAAVAIDNARLFELEHEIARTLQRSLLPASLPDTDPLEIATRYRAAGEGMEVGGDVFDVFVADGAPHAMVADVCGKGPEAAALTATARHALRSRAGDAEPVAMLAHVDQVLRDEDHGDRFCTMAVARFDIRDGGASALATVSLGGHPPPIVARGDGSIEVLDLTGSLIGVLADAEFDQVAVELDPGDVMVLYTDGVTESRRDRDLFGEERLVAAIERAAHGEPGEILDAVLTATLEFAGGEPQDDIALLAVRLRPVAAWDGEAATAGERRRGDRRAG